MPPDDDDDDSDDDASPDVAIVNLITRCTELKTKGNEHFKAGECGATNGAARSPARPLFFRCLDLYASLFEMRIASWSLLLCCRAH